VIYSQEGSKRNHHNLNKEDESWKEQRGKKRRDDGMEKDKFRTKFEKFRSDARGCVGDETKGRGKVEMRIR